MQRKVQFLQPTPSAVLPNGIDKNLQFDPMMARETNYIDKKV